MRTAPSIAENIRPILASIRTVPIETHVVREISPTRPFVTFSRQPGIDAWDLAQELVKKLNVPDVTPQWTSWDRELVEKVAADHHLSSRLIESLEETRRSVIMDLLRGLSYHHEPDDLAVYHRVAETMAALAQSGHVILVGRGGHLVTAAIPGGIHVRLVAPLADRIRMFQEARKLTREEAENWISDAEIARASFYSRFWPRRKLDPESFSLTLNMSQLNTTEAVALLSQIIHCRIPAAKSTAAGV